MFNYIDNVSSDIRAKYNHMLDTNAVLLLIDQWAFLEEDEFAIESFSVSWLHSLPRSLELFGLDPQHYPQGSISANRHYYEALRNYCGGQFPENTDYNFLRNGIKNFLKLRRDDSSNSSSILFGSYFRISDSQGSHDQHKFREVFVNLRHTANALWVLLEESEDFISEQIIESLNHYFHRIDRYLCKNIDWNRDKYKHLTLSSTLNVCNSVLKKPKYKNIMSMAQELKSRCEQALFDKNTIKQDLDGNYYWIVPNIKEQPLAKYEYYLNGFVFTQAPLLMEDERAQSIIKSMIKNRANSTDGYGIPIHKLINFKKRSEIIPDFGSSAVTLYLLNKCIEEKIGGNKWIEFCEENIMELVHFCLSSYDKVQYYRFPINENNTKILLLPRHNPKEEQDKIIELFISNIKREIYDEMINHKGNLTKKLKKLQCPKGLEHVIELVDKWQISKYWKRQNRWRFVLPNEKLAEYCGNFIGAYTGSFLKNDLS